MTHKASADRPCFDRGHRFSHGRVLLNVNGPVNGLVPDGRFVRPVNDVDLDFDCSRQHGEAAVLGYRLQLVRGSLERTQGGRRRRQRYKGLSIHSVHFFFVVILSLVLLKYIGANQIPKVIIPIHCSRRVYTSIMNNIYTQTSL